MNENLSGRYTDMQDNILSLRSLEAEVLGECGCFFFLFFFFLTRRTKLRSKDIKITFDFIKEEISFLRIFEHE